VKQALHVHCVDAIELLLGNVEQGLIAMRRARVVDQDIQPGKGVQRELQHRLPVRILRHIALEECRLAAGGIDFLDTRSPPSTLMSFTTILQPSSAKRLAIPSPKPEPAPVTIAILFFNLIYPSPSK
jgi:hypothetical protein